MESTNHLTDFERKLLTILRNSIRKGTHPSLRVLELRTGRSEKELQKTIDNLINKKWLSVHDGKLILNKRLF